MKYWILTTEFPPFHGGGISTYCKFTATSFAKNEIDVTVFVPDSAVASFEASVYERKVSVVRFNPNFCGKAGVLGYSANLSYSFAEIIKLYIGREGSPDFIEAQDYLGIAYYLLQFKLTGLLELQEVPIVITLHSPAFIYLDYNRVPTYRFPEFWTCEMEKNAIIAADILISPTQFIIDEIAKYLDISKKKIYVIPNPFESDLKPKRSSFERNHIVFYGKLSAQKGSFKMLEYFVELWNEGFDVVLSVIGGTDIVYHPEYLTMHQIVKQRYKKYIEQGVLRLEGKISPNDISARLKDAHLILVPSIVDNLPYVVLESMANMKPVLASIQGGQREIITDKENGFLFDHTVSNSFKSTLVDILNMSDEAIHKVAYAGFKSLKRYSTNEILPLKISLLENLKQEYKNTENRRFPFVFQEGGSFKSENSNDLLSIVVTYFNMGKYIDDCLISIFASDYPFKEVIIVNDGSTDVLSINKLKSLSLRNDIKIISQTNKGVAEARNKGAEVASGRFLAFLDADDKISSTYYSKAVSILKEYFNVFFVGSWVQYFGRSSSVWPTFNPQPPYLLVHNTVNSSSLVYERDAFLTSGKNDKTVDYGLEDYESVVSLISSGANGVVIPEVHFYYRVRSDSMIRSIRQEKWLYSYKYIGSKHEKYFSKFSSSIINLLNANGPGYIYDNPTLDQSRFHKLKIPVFIVSYIKTKANQFPVLKKTLIKLTNLNKLK